MSRRTMPVPTEAGTAAAPPLPQRLLGILCRKWACRVLIELVAGPKRFGVLARGVLGLRRAVLARELVRLVGEGLVRKKDLSKKPRQVSYALTAAGISLCHLLHDLGKWEARHLPSRVVTPM